MFDNEYLNLIIFVFITLWVIAVWVFVAITLKRGLEPWFKKRKMASERIYAVVKDKRTHEVFDHLQMENVPFETVIVFDCRDGVEREYNVHDKLFAYLEKGDDGELEYKDEDFVAFRSNKETRDLDDLYKKLVK